MSAKLPDYGRGYRAGYRAGDAKGARRLRRENAALRADRDRLDSGTIVLPVRGEPVCFVGTDLRAAIDAAIRKAQT